MFSVLGFARIRTFAVFALESRIDLVPSSLVFFELTSCAKASVASTAGKHGLYAFVLMRSFDMLSHLLDLSEELAAENTLQR